MNNEIRRSRVYSYFHGASTVFQKFLLIVGIFVLLLQPVANTATYKAYDKYLDACDMMDKAKETYNEFRETSPSSEGWTTVLLLLAIVIIPCSLIWIIVKKRTLSKTDELAVDKVLAEKIEEAKKKAVEKFDLVAGQADKIEPIVLNGVADMKKCRTTAQTSGFKQKFIKTLLVIGKVLAYAVLLAAIVLIDNELAVTGMPFIIVFVLNAWLLGFGGYKLYNKYEKDCYISPRTIDALEKFDPELIARIGSDDRIRFSVPSITIYMFSGDRLYMYCQYVDLVTEKVLFEGVNEYFYKDIVAVTSTQETKRIFKKEDLLTWKKIEYLRENITVTTSGCSHVESYDVDMDESLLDTKFVAMRNLIRQKKEEK